MGDKGNGGTQLSANLALVDVISQAVGDEVVGQELHVVLGARLGASTRVSRDTEAGGLAAKEGNEGSNSKLGSGGVASRVGNAGGTGNLGALNQLGKTVGPLGVEAVVGAEVNDDVALLGALVDGIDKGLADAVGQSHDPAVDVAVGGHLADIVGAEVLVGDVALLVALELLASQLAGGDVAEIHVGVGVEQVDQSLASVATGADEGNLGGLGVGVVLLSERGVRVGGGVGTEGVDRNSGTGGAVHAQGVGDGGETALLLSRGAAGTVALANVGGGLGGAVEAGLEVDVTEHLAAVLVEFLNQLLHLFAVLGSVPEENLAVAAQAAVGLVEKPGQVLVVLLDGPGELGEVLLDAGKDVVGNVGQPSGLGDGESGQVGHLGARLGGKDNSEGLHGLVVEDLKVLLLHALDVTVDDGTSIETLAVADEHLLQGVHVLELRQRGLDVDLVTTADQGTGTGVGEQLLLEIGGVDDGHAGRARQVAQQVLHLLDLQTSAVAHPPLVHEVVVLLIQVDSGDLLTGITVEQTTLFSEVDNLEGLQGACKLTGSDIRIDVKDLTIAGLGHGSQNGEAASGNGRLNGSLVNAVDLTNQVVLGLVQVVGGKDTGGDGARTDTDALELLHQLHVLLQEQLTGQSQGLAVSDTDSILELGLDAGGLQHAVELGAGTVHDDGVETDVVQEGERGGEGLQVLGDDGTTDLDHGELLGRDGGEVGEVLLDLALGTNVAQQLHDGAASGGEVRIGGARVAASLAEGGGLAGRDSQRRSSRCGEGTEGLARSSPHSGAKGHHCGNAHAATSTVSQVESLRI